MEASPIFTIAFWMFARNRAMTKLFAMFVITCNDTHPLQARLNAKSVESLRVSLKQHAMMQLLVQDESPAVVAMRCSGNPSSLLSVLNTSKRIKNVHSLCLRNAGFVGVRGTMQTRWSGLCTLQKKIFMYFTMILCGDSACSANIRNPKPVFESGVESGELCSEYIWCSTTIWHLETCCLKPIITKKCILGYPAESPLVSIHRSSLVIHSIKTRLKIGFSSVPRVMSTADKRFSPVSDDSPLRRPFT
jgi:hypothetical protein